MISSYIPRHVDNQVFNPPFLSQDMILINQVIFFFFFHPRIPEPFKRVLYRPYVMCQLLTPRLKFRYSFIVKKVRYKPDLGVPKSRFV